MNPTFSFVVLLAIGSICEAEHNGGTWRGDYLRGSWVITSCSGNDVLKSFANNNFWIYYNVRAIGETDYVTWMGSTEGDGLTKGYFDASQATGFTKIRCRIEREEYPEEDKEFQKTWVNLCQKLNHFEFKSKDEHVIHFGDGLNDPQCAFKRDI